MIIEIDLSHWMVKFFGYLFGIMLLAIVAFAFVAKVIQWTHPCSSYSLQNFTDGQMLCEESKKKTTH